MAFAPLALNLALDFEGKNGAVGYYEKRGKNFAYNRGLRGRAGTTFGPKRAWKSRFT